MDFLVLIAGLTGLWLGTELTIRAAVTIAARLGVSEFVVGVAILSIGSDLPELAIAIDVGLKNLRSGEASAVVVGSAIGSSLGQIGFVLGLAALFSYLTLPKRSVHRHGAVLLGSLLLLGLLGWDGDVTRTEGVALVAVYAIYFAVLLRDANGPKSDDGLSTNQLLRAWLFLLLGLVVVIVAAEVTVSAAIAVARTLEISEAVVAIIVIGLGTSLPELSISLGAVLRNHNHLSVGNLIGSNIFDTLVPIGVAAVISGIRFDHDMLTHELPFLFGLTAIVLFFFIRKHGIQKWEAATILGLYCGYASIKVANAQA